MSLTDHFHRQHSYLRISLTERCNLRCFYCMPEEGIKLRPRQEFMTRSEVFEIAKTFVAMGVNKIRLTGGEPLVRNDAADIIRNLSTLPIELAITSNGILIDEYLDVFKTAGLRSVNISLDSLQPDRFATIARRDHFHRVMNNIDLLLANQFHVKLNTVLIKGVNDDEITDFIDHTRDRNVHIRFIEFMPFDGNRWIRDRVISYDEIIDKAALKYGNKVIRIQDRMNDTSKNYAIEGHTGTFAIISTVTNPFCDSCNRLRLTADGKMKNCLFSFGETDLLTAFRAGNDIRPLITDNVLRKKELRGGMESVESFGQQQNRTMIAIGG